MKRRAFRTFLVAALMAAVALWTVIPAPAVPVRVRWAGVTDGERAALERQFELEAGEYADGTTWVYALRDYSSENIRRLVEHASVVDTHGLQRERFEPDSTPPSRIGRVVLGALLAGAAAVLILYSGTPLFSAPVEIAVSVSSIVAIVTLLYMPVLVSGGLLGTNHDFFLYASRHEAVVESLFRYGTLPLRAHWFGGGFNTIADPEDPTFNPLVLLSLLFGTVMGLKVIGYVSMLIGGLSTYVLATRVLGFTEWGARFSALVFAACLFIPSRIAGGNFNEVYGAWLPLCVLLVALAIEGRRWATVLLGVVFYTMMTDGKMTAITAMGCIGVLSLLAVHPALRIYPLPAASAASLDYRPLKVWVLAAALSLVIGLPRLLPAFEVIRDAGGIAAMVPSHPQAYTPEGVYAYSFDEFGKGLLGTDRPVSAETFNRDLVTIGALPVVLGVVGCLVFWRQALPWAIVALLSSWLLLAHHAPVDLLAVLWKLPVFNTVYRPYKYFSFPLLFTIVIAGGYAFHLLRQLHSRRVEALVAVILIVFSVGFVYPRSAALLAGSFTVEPPPSGEPGEFYSVRAGENARAVAYFNISHNVGTLNGFTAVPVATTAAPRYFLDDNGAKTANADYRGEVYFLESPDAGAIRSWTFEPNAILLSVELRTPATVVINQNFHRDWSSSVGSVANHNGLLAVRLPQPGAHEIRLNYRPRAFYTGVGLMGLAAVAFGATQWRRRRRG